jgi:hypothetical protein
LSTLPAEQRYKIIDALSKVTAKGVPIQMNQNRLTPPEYEQNQNALAR